MLSRGAIPCNKNASLIYGNGPKEGKVCCRYVWTRRLCHAAMVGACVVPCMGSQRGTVCLSAHQCPAFRKRGLPAVTSKWQFGVCMGMRCAQQVYVIMLCASEQRY